MAKSAYPAEDDHPLRWRWSFRTTLLVATFAVLLCAIGLLGGVTLQDWYAPRSGPTVLEEAPLGEVIAGLELEGVLPEGTEWEEPSLAQRHVTTRWLFARDTSILRYLSTAAGVVIECPVGHHGDLRGPVTVRAARPGEAPGVQYGSGLVPLSRAGEGGGDRYLRSAW